MSDIFKQQNLFSGDKVYTVLELNQEARQVLRKGFSQDVWVCGEIQNLRLQRGKNHMYFSLVQKDPDSDNILAQVDANLFAGIRQIVEKRIKAAAANFELRNDIEVKFLCEVDLYAPRGKFNVNIKDIDPVYTLGKVAQNRLKIIEDLRKRGLLEKNRLDNELSPVPLNIGLITAVDSAAYHDFTNELSLSRYAFKVFAYNCHMQGKMVEADVLRALNYFAKKLVNELDLVVITRGGGSTADLSYFDNKKIAEAIAQLPLPLISAVGHQIDSTVIDLVAHTACKTPTKAAQFIVETVGAFITRLEQAGEVVGKKSLEIITLKRKELHNLSVKFESSAMRYFRVHREEVITLRQAVIAAVKLAMGREKTAIEQYFNSMKVQSQAVLRRYKELLDYAAKKVDLLDPKNTLKRGYSITRKNAKALRGVGDVAPGEDIETILYDGSIVSRVTNKKNNLDI